MANQPIANITAVVAFTDAGAIAAGYPKVYGLGGGTGSTCNDVFVWNTTTEEWDLYT